MSLLEFYPTPESLIDKMIYKFDIRTVEDILEPSAGKGDILDKLVSRKRISVYSKKDTLRIDTIELDEELRHILRGKGFRVIHDDFLTFEVKKRYDLVIMNPPFSEGDKHLLKAIDVQKRGGKIVCILNAETLRNDYSSTRKELKYKLESLNASVEYMSGEFENAERKTNVEIAMVYIDIPVSNEDSTILENLKKGREYKSKIEESNYLTSNDLFEAMVNRFNIEAEAGIKLIEEYHALLPLISDKFEGNSPILELNVKKVYYNDEFRGCGKDNIINRYLSQLRFKYWETLLQSDKFSKVMTTSLRDIYRDKLVELSEYDFSMYNIGQVWVDVGKLLSKGVEDTIIALFDEFSSQSYDEYSRNIHYFNGWKTNKCWIINKRVITRLSAFCSYMGVYQPDWYTVVEKLSDIEKVFNYLDNGRSENIDLKEVLKKARDTGNRTKIDTKYFLVTFYAKGTTHLEFKDLELLKKFNIFGSQRKGWLPPAYGKKSYDEMDEKEKECVNSFEGKSSYKNTVDNADFLIYKTSDLLMLEG